MKDLSMEQSEHDKTSVWIVDDNQNFCIILSEALNRSETMHCDCSYHSVKAVVRGLQERETWPRIILLDIKMPQMTGIDGISSIKKLRPEVLVVMLTSYDDEDDIRIALQRGASGYLSKTSNYQDIIRSLERLLEDGGKILDPGIADKIISSVVGNQEARDYNLSRREKEIIDILITGESVQQIASRLNISFYTVETHLKNIYKKLNVHTSRAVVAKAIKENLIS
jgi:DNA-binding NarL/FixJ family response regulator